ncbi:MAG: cytochrome c3 family protein, partial [Pseudobdellovibrio sp.]
MIKHLNILFILLFSVVTWAQSEGILNQLLAPGPLISGHAKLEGKDCLKCHEAGKGVSVPLCLECHKDIKTQIYSKKGFHSIAMQSKTCINCHTDHKGRDNDTTLVDQKNFDHLSKTGYDLKGKHAELKCQECHTDKRTNMQVRKSDIRFLSKQSSCVSCHKKDDIHFYKGTWAQKDCNACHSNNSWKNELTFNHNTDTKFKLIEKHVDLKCHDCHKVDKKNNIFKYTWPKLQQDGCLN